MGFRQFSLPNPTPGGSPYVDHLATLVDSLITLHATSTVTDNDGDTATANAAVQIGANLVFHDDGPSVSATLNANAQVVLDETATSSSISAITLVEIVKGDDPDVSGSGTISSGNSGSAVLNAAALFGADGPASSGSLSYALSIQNATSGLKVTDGSAINLALNNGAIVGVVAGGAFAGQAAFAISINASGVVTVEQYLSLQHPDATNPDDTVFLSAGHIGVAATATDFDGDKTSTSVVDLSGQIVFHDDAGTLGAFSNATLINGPNVHGLGTFSYVPGADGHGSFMITGPALPGVTYTTVQNATGALLTATADSDGAGPNPPVTVFTLQVNTDGTYDFTLVAPQTATTETVSLLGLSAGGPSPFVQTADGHVEFSGSAMGSTRRPKALASAISSSQTAKASRLSSIIRDKLGIRRRTSIPTWSARSRSITTASMDRLRSRSPTTTMSRVLPRCRPTTWPAAQPCSTR